MYYGDEKKRQMARSVLPSKRRNSSKCILKAIRRNKRREARQELRLIVAEENFGEFTERDIYRDENIDLYRAVQDRRDADKLTHFMTWAIKVTDGMEPNARMAHMIKVLPDNMIGWHARSHLQFVDEFVLNPFRYGRTGDPYYSKRPHPFQHRFAEKKFDLGETLRDLIENQEAREALQDYMLRKHKTCSWITSYGAPLRKRVETYVPSRKSSYSKHFRSGGYWTVTVTVSPNVLSERSVGPSRPPRVPASTEGLVEFLDLLRASSEAAKRITAEPWWSQTESVLHFVAERGAGPESCVDYLAGPTRSNLETRANPDHHPEWFKAATEFCKAWVENNRDLYSTLAALR